MSAEQRLFSDTPLEIERLQLAGYRRMTPQEKFQRIRELNLAGQAMAAERIARQYGRDLAEREVLLRLAALRLDRETMVKVFSWDPEEKGY
jgi:hypothetical protein